MQIYARKRKVLNVMRHYFQFLQTSFVARFDWSFVFVAVMQMQCAVDVVGGVRKRLSGKSRENKHR